MTSASALEYRSRYELVEEARSLGVERPERMTVQELKDEILRLTLSAEEAQGARGLFGVARAMLASVVEAGLKMPDAARVIRGDSSLDLPARSLSPVATVTLAEIYAAQGHRARALAVLDEVLQAEPDHPEALRIRDEMLAGEPAAAKDPPARPSPGTAALSRPEAMVSEPSYPAPEESGFPSTEYVPVEVVETTGHEAPASPEPPPVVATEDPGAPLLAIEQRGSTLGLYWELSPDLVARAGLSEDEGGPAIVVVAFTPAGRSPVRDQRTLPLTWQPPFAGRLVVADLAPQAAVRAAVGWLVDGAFLPLAVGRSLDRLGAELPAAADRAALALAGR